MKGLSDVAVFGLVAVPLPTLCGSGNEEDRRPTPSEEAATSKVASREIPERMATREEVERIRFEVGRIDATPIGQPKPAL